VKYRLILSALLAWLPLGLHSEPFTYESAAELSAALDASGDGLPDLVVVDKATGVRQLAIQQADGSFAWAEPRSTGLDGVTALTAGWFARAGAAEGFAVAAPRWNRVSVVPNPFDPETYFNALAPGVGPNLVVALDMGGEAGLDDLAIATCWEDPPSDSRLYASAWNGITTSNLYDLVEGQSGPLTHGNRAWLSNPSSLLVGMMRPTGATSEFLTRIPGTLGYDVGPAVTGLPPGATWVWGVFAASGYSQFLFYAPAESTLYLRPVEELTPGVFTFGSGAAFDLGEPIQQVCVLPQTTGALLLIVFGDGATSGIFDFDGTNAPVLRQTLTAPPGNLYSLAGSLDDGNLLLLHGPAGGGGTSTGWERWALEGLQHTLTGSGSLPTFTPTSGRANVLVYNNDPGLNPDAELQLMFQAGDWSVEADTTHRVLDVTAETFIDSTSGLGSPTVTGFSRRPPGFYVPGLNEIAATVNQRSASASVACLSPALGIPMGEIAFNPPSGVYPPTAGGGLTVRLTATPDGPVHYRTDPSQPWTLYSAANPPAVGSGTTLWAYADNRTGFSYYDYADYAWHYADNDAYSPIRTATYRIAATPALQPAPQEDANGDGLGDAWATALGITDPLADPDGDGADNRAEFAGASDPLDPASVPTASITYTLTYLAGDHGVIDGPTPQTVESGSSGTTVTAEPASGYSFIRWSDGSTTNPRTDTPVMADLTVTAEFADITPPEPPVVRRDLGAIAGVGIHSVSSEFGSGGWDLRAVHLVDGSGISGEPPGHAQTVYPGGESWQTDTSSGTGSVTFDLLAPRQLHQVHVWNLNFLPPYHGRGAREVAILTSLNSTDWTAEGTVIFTVATGANGDPGFDLDATGWSAARYVRFDLLSNFGLADNAGHVGLSEVRFFRELPSHSSARPTWTWSSGGGGGNGTFRVKLDDPNLTTGATLAASPTWTPDGPLSDGVHTLYVQEQDDAGNWSASGWSAIAVDATPPTVTGLADDAVPAKSKTWAWGGAKEVISFRHQIDTDPAGVPAGPYTGVTTATQPTGDGVYYLHVQASDGAGNESAVVTVHAILDNTAPVVTGLSDDPGPWPSKTWSWGATDADPARQYRYAVDQLPTATPDGAYGEETAATQAGVDGTWYLHVQARDRAGNESTVLTVSVLLDSTPPHQADQNHDGVIQLAPELTRLIQFYNSSGYHCEGGTEDGYAPEAGDTTCAPHQSDQNADWVIQLSPELTRLIQFHNLGGYHLQEGTEDGYAPGLAGGKAAAETGVLTSLRQVGAAASAADGAVDVTLILAHSAPAELTSLAVQEILPVGWTFLGVVDDTAPDIVPQAGTTGTLGFAWIKLPATWPVKLTYRVAAPASTSSPPCFSGRASVRTNGAETVVLTAAAPVVDAVARGQNWFDLSGMYSTAVAGNPLTLQVLHDTRGRLTGTATLQLSPGEQPELVTMLIKGNARGSGGNLVATLLMRGDSEARMLRVSLTLDLALDPVVRQLAGQAVGSIAVGTTAAPLSQAVTLDLPAAMDGTWILRLNQPPAASARGGGATLTLANGANYRLAVAGQTGGPETVVLMLSGHPSDPPAHGISIRTTLTTRKDDSTAFLLFLGKGYGQTLMW
jgi:hypothetical protein